MTMHIGNFVRFNARQRPDAIALRSDNRTISYSTLDRLAAGCAAALRRMGVRAGDRVIFILPNSIEWVVLYQGVLQIGGIPVPINARLTPAELFPIMTNCDPKLVFAPSSLAKQLKTASKLASRVHDFDCNELARREATPGPLPATAADDVAVILYSSGSTGQPKGVELTHLNIFWNAQAFAFDLLRLMPEDRGFTALPFSHVFGHTCLYSAFLFAGASISIADRFDPVDAIRTIHDDRITIFMGVPTMYWSLGRVELPPGLDWSSWRACVSGGQALAEDVHRRFEQRFGVPISEGYGMTEASPSVTGSRLYGSPRKFGSAGQPYWGVSLRIVDDEGADVPAGATGEILISGPGVARGYFRQPKLTAETFRNGWIHSGDIGRIDEDGYLFVVDRKKELIISGGYNIYPREIEETAHGLEGILEVAAIGVPDERLGERILAFVVPLPGAALSPESFLEQCAGRLARYKVPREVRLIDALPRNATGKIDRGKLRLMGREGTSRNVT
jgi:long-chain acyl-CoA synthetase